ncbi:MAG: carboxypeptidase-like regulatory domain-containing protein [Bacteroidetes bacterium]|nr:carboxypeptidase-like regulatory domain-containing protein [Bacteroidota bacterium]
MLHIIAKRFLFYSSIYVLFFVMLFYTTESKSQDNLNQKKLIQFSGIVVNSDSIEPAPFVNIIIKNTNKGTISDHNGFFSFVAKEGDIIVFSGMGYKSTSFMIPNNLTQQRYTWIQPLSVDTVYLSETVIYPWQTFEQFKKAFVELQVPNDDEQRAEKNLNLAEMREKAQNIPMDGSMNFRNYIDNQVYRNYYKGQAMPNNLLNPIAWAKFIKAIKEGKFKKK